MLILSFELAVEETEIRLDVVRELQERTHPFARLVLARELAVYLIAKFARQVEEAERLLCLVRCSQSHGVGWAVSGHSVCIVEGVKFQEA